MLARFVPKEGEGAPPTPVSHAPARPARFGVYSARTHVEAVAGTVALALAQQERERLAKLAEALKAPAQDVEAKLLQVLESVKVLEKEIAKRIAWWDDLKRRASDKGTGEEK